MRSNELHVFVAACMQRTVQLKRLYFFSARNSISSGASSVDRGYWIFEPRWTNIARCARIVPTSGVEMKTALARRRPLAARSFRRDEDEEVAFGGVGPLLSSRRAVYLENSRIAMPNAHTATDVSGRAACKGRGRDTARSRFDSRSVSTTISVSKSRSDSLDD